MSEPRHSARDQDAGHHGHPHSRFVTVIVDNEEKSVEAGTYSVSEFKEMVGVPADKELDVVKGAQLVPLADDGQIKVHPHERFVSHARTGGSS